METQASSALNAARDSIDRQRRSHCRIRRMGAALILGAGGLLSAPARAADGCLVLLCLAAPSWSSIAQCVDPVRQVLRDLARGRPFPSCAMSGAGNTARQEWASAPGFCPPQY